MSGVLQSPGVQTGPPKALPHPHRAEAVRLSVREGIFGGAQAHRAQAAMRTIYINFLGAVRKSRVLPNEASRVVLWDWECRTRLRA